jgi:hypothetical protein
MFFTQSHTFCTEAIFSPELVALLVPEDPDEALLSEVLVLPVVILSELEPLVESVLPALACMFEQSDLTFAC